MHYVLFLYLALGSGSILMPAEKKKVQEPMLFETAAECREYAEPFKETKLQLNKKQSVPIFSGFVCLPESALKGLGWEQDGKGRWYNARVTGRQS